jgi:dipeptidase
MAEGYGSMMEFNDNSAFWVFNQVANFAYTRYSDIIPEVRTLQKELETKFITETKDIDKKAEELYKSSPKKATEFLTAYSVKTGNETVARWKKFYGYLFCKFMDGNIKTTGINKVSPKVKQPGYGDPWYWMIIKETRNKFRIIGEAGH